jgi:hypothetical protein
MMKGGGMKLEAQHYLLISASSQVMPPVSIGRLEPAFTQNLTDRMVVYI